MGFTKLSDFESALQQHTRRVRQIYDQILGTAVPLEPSTAPTDFDDADGTWQQTLATHGFRDPRKALRLMKEFTQGPGFGHVSPRTRELAQALLPKFLALCPDSQRLAKAIPGHLRVLSDPDRVLARLDHFVEAYGARATLFETWTANSSLFELLLWLFDRSEFLAETAVRTPDLVDELVLSGRLLRRKSAEETLADLQHGQADEDQRLWLRRYHQAEFMRIGLREILGLADLEQNLIELTSLADACLQYALEVVMRQHRLKKPPFVTIGLGKLGGRELNYGSDLDIMFVAENTRDLPGRQRLATQVMELLSAPTELGVAFVTDARLRPDGEKGLLVNTLAAYEEYYRHRAALWEIQSLTRTRPVAGHMVLGKQFQEMAAQLTDFRHPPASLAAYSPGWKAEIARMRRRIEKERTPASKEALAIKTGAGGLMDAEFAAQVLSLAHAWHQPNTMAALLRAQAEGVLNSKDAQQLIENYRALRRVEGILRRWSYEGETVLPDQDAPLLRVALRCGWPSAAQFLAAVADYRRAIRQIYLKILPHPEP